ncbi:MAG: preprotein translocase subunit SecG [Ruminococcaceae bacterium]|nr:preprotein translocase subunit SecG [Oscillospiraceae bacterium]
MEPITATVLTYVFGITLLVLATALSVLVMLQSGKDKKLSGAIAGGSNSFYGKTKGSDRSKVLSVVTSAVAIVFVVFVFVTYIIL